MIAPCIPLRSKIYANSAVGGRKKQARLINVYWPHVLGMKTQLKQLLFAQVANVNN
jgi:hypothetical protein